MNGFCDICQKPVTVTIRDQGPDGEATRSFCSVHASTSIRPKPLTKSALLTGVQNAIDEIEQQVVRQDGLSEDAPLNDSQVLLAYLRQVHDFIAEQGRLPTDDEVGRDPFAQNSDD